MISRPLRISTNCAMTKFTPRSLRRESTDSMESLESAFFATFRTAIKIATADTFQGNGWIPGIPASATAQRTRGKSRQLYGRPTNRLQIRDQCVKMSRSAVFSEILNCPLSACAQIRYNAVTEKVKYVPANRLQFRNQRVKLSCPTVFGGILNSPLSACRSVITL